MTVGAHLGVDVKIVQQHELPRQGVVVRRYFFGKKTQARVTVTLRHISEHLIVGAILFDNVKNILYRRGPANRARNGIAFLAFTHSLSFLIIGRVFVH